MGPFCSEGYLGNRKRLHMGKEGGIGVGDNGHPWLFQDGGFAGEGAELGGEDVEVVEAAIVAVGGNCCYH